MTDLRCEIRIGPQGRAGRRPQVRVGESALVAAHFLDDAGVLFAGVGGVSIAVTDPLGATTTWSGADLVVPVAGAAQRQVTFAIPGNWVIRATATSPNATVAELVLPVAGSVAAPIGPVTPTVEQAIAASVLGFDQKIDLAWMVYVISGVGVPVANYVHGTTVLPDDTAKLNAGIAQACALGFTRVGTRGVVVRADSVLQFFKGMVLTNSVGVDVQDAVGGASGYHKLPHWQLGPNAKIVGSGGAMRTEDFLAISTAWTPVAPGADPVLDNTAQRAALTHQIRGYAGACLEWQGDGNAVIRSTLLGFIRPWDFTRGGRHHWDSVIIDVGGTMEQYGVGFRLTRSGGAPRGRACHVVTLGIKNVTGVNALDHVILAASQVTSGTHTGKTRITIGYCYHLKYRLWVDGSQRGGQVSKGDERVVNYSADPFNVDLHLFEVKKRGDWITGTVAPGTGTTLTEAHIGATFSDGAVEWVYRGPYTGVRFDADRPSQYLLTKDTNPAGAWGHRVVVNVDPSVLYDEANLDPRVRGHYEVLAAGTQAADQAQWILDLPWQAHFATALPAGGLMSVYPGLRIAKSIEAQGDGLYLDGWTNKGCLVAGDMEASNGTAIDLSEEEASEGEFSVDNKHSLGYRFGPRSAGMALLGGGHKNLGYCMVVDTGQDQPVEYVAKESSGGAVAGIWVKSGTLRVSGGHIRGFAMRIRVDEDGFADLSGLTTAAGLEITGEGWEKRVIMPRVGVTGPALGRQVIAGPGKIEIGETAATTPWAPLTAVTTGLRRQVRGVQGDLWRLRCTTSGTTAATAPDVTRQKKAWEPGIAYAVGKDLWLVGGDGNAHLVQVATTSGAGLSGGSPPAVTDATTTIADGNLTLRRLGRYTGPGALVPDGSAVWAIEDIDLGVRGRITYDPETGRGELASFTGGGARNVRLAWGEDHGAEVDGLYHIGSARDLISARGDYRPRRRTLAQITTNDADAAAGNLSRLVLATNAEGGEAIAHATDDGAAVAYARQDWTKARALSAGLNRLPIEWVERDYAAELGGATLATDARKVIQYAWTLAAASGARVTLGTPGVYALDSSQASSLEWPNGPTANGSNRGALVVAGGLDFEALDTCIFESAITLAGARGMVTTDRGNYRQAGFTPPSGVRIAGGLWRKRSGSAAEGSVFGIEADGLRLVRTLVEAWQNGRAYNLAGNGHRHERPGMRNPVGGLQSGGMRFWYGDDFECEGLWGTSGDDAAQFVGNFDPSGFWYGDITNSWYRDLHVRSEEARCIAAALPAQNGVTPSAAGTTSSIRNSGFVGGLCTSGSQGVPFNIQNQFSSGVVAGLLIQGITFDHSLSSRTNGWEIAGAWGGVEDVTVELCALVGAYRDLLNIEGRVRSPAFRRNRIYAPRTEDASFRPIRVKGASGLRVEGGFAEMMAVAPVSPANALIDLAISTSTDTYSGDTYTTTLDGARIGDGFEARNIRDSTFAVRTTRANQLEIDGMKLVRAAGATASSVKALSVVGSANGTPIIVRDNDFTDSTAEEDECVNDANRIVIRQGWNHGLKAPIQPVANVNNDNGIIGPGVTRAELTTTGATYAITLNAPSLADRAAGGLVIEMVARGGSNNVTLALTNVSGAGAATTATFDAVGDALVLQPLGGKWHLIANSGVTLT